MTSPPVNPPSTNSARIVRLELTHPQACTLLLALEGWADAQEDKAELGWNENAAFHADQAEAARSLHNLIETQANRSLAADVGSVLADAAAGIDRTCRDLHAAVKSMPDDAPLFSVVDLVVAIGHLRQAARRVDRAHRAIQPAKAGAR